MKEVKTIPNEKIEKKGLDLSVLRKKGKANTFSGWLIGRMKICKNDKNWELAKVYEEIYLKFWKFHPRKLNKIELKNWKGKDTPSLYKDFYGDFVIVTHRKDKDGEVNKQTRNIKKEDVNYLKNLIKTIKLGERIKYKEIISIMIKDKNLPCNRDSFNGGRNRALYYFPLYQHPARILEELGLIKYSSKGIIERLK